MNYSNVSTTQNVITSGEEQSHLFLWLWATDLCRNFLLPPYFVCLHSWSTTEFLHLLCATIPWSSNLQPSDREIDLIAWYPEEYRTALLSVPTHYILRKVSREEFFPSFWCNHCLLDTWALNSCCGSTDISQESHKSIPHAPRSWTAHM